MATLFLVTHSDELKQVASLSKPSDTIVLMPDGLDGGPAEAQIVTDSDLARGETISWPDLVELTLSHQQVVTW